MTENTNPSVYTTPDTDGDDVLGHAQGDRAAADAPEFRAARDEAPGFRAYEKAPSATDGEDVEGHGYRDTADAPDLRTLDEAPGFAARDKVGQNDENDVEGHLYRDRVAEAAPDFAARDKVAQNDDDDVEGHLRQL